MDPRDVLTDDEYRELAHLAQDLVERLTRRLAAAPGPNAADPGPKPGESAEEHRQRTATLRRVHAARLAGALLDDVADRFAAAEAADAVWLGASLADLGAASGDTRQAARKRWPDLGQIYRVRRWLGGHHDDVLAVIGAVLDHAGALRGVGLDRIQALRDAVDPEQPGRWQRLAEAVDRHLRAVTAVAVPTTDAAATALDGAVGVIARYDSVAGPVPDPVPGPVSAATPPARP